MFLCQNEMSNSPKSFKEQVPKTLFGMKSENVINMTETEENGCTGSLGNKYTAERKSLNHIKINHSSSWRALSVAWMGKLPVIQKILSTLYPSRKYFGIRGQR